MNGNYGKARPATEYPGKEPEDKRSDMIQIKSDSPAGESVEKNRTDRDRRSPPGRQDGKRLWILKGQREWYPYNADLLRPSL